MGTATPALLASASSGLTVTFTSSPSTVCSVSGTTLTLVAAGSCTVTANQAGNSGYAAAAAIARTFTVAAAATGPSVANGKALYEANNPVSCASCHGALATTQNAQKGANNPSKIQSAITNNKGSMGTFYSGKFTAQNLADIAAFIAAPY